MENGWFLLFSLDDGGGLRGSVYAGVAASAGDASRQESRLEMNENESMLLVLDAGAAMWRTSVRFVKTTGQKALSKPRLRPVL